MSHAIKHLFHINAPLESVFRALTSIEELKSWYTTQVGGSSEPDHVIEFKFGDIDFHAKVVELIPNKKIVWECIATSLPLVGHKMIFDLDQNDHKTRIRYTQEGFEDADDLYANMNFSMGKYLESLRQFCQQGISEAFGSEGYRS